MQFTVDLLFYPRDLDCYFYSLWGGTHLEVPNAWHSCHQVPKFPQLWDSCTLITSWSIAMISGPSSLLSSPNLWAIASRSGSRTHLWDILDKSLIKYLLIDCLWLQSMFIQMRGGPSSLVNKQGGHIWSWMGWLHSSKPSHKTQCSLETSAILQAAVVHGRRKTHWTQGHLKMWACRHAQRY